MGRHAIERSPTGDAALFEGLGIEPIGLAALIEGRDDLSAVDHHIGAGGILHGPLRAKAGAQRDLGAIHQSAPERLTGLLLGLKAARADKTVTIVGAATLEVDHVDHAVAVEGMVTTQRLLHRIFGVAHIDPVNIGGNCALDDV